MNLATLGVKNVARHKGRTALTAIGIAVAIVLFMLMRTVVLSWTGAVDASAKDRIATRHKVTFIMQLPKRYVEDIGNMPGVTKVNGVPQVTWANWFGAKDPNRPDDFFGTIATDPATFLSVYDEIIVDPAQATAWKQDRRGALVGDSLAKKFGWKVGDKVVLQGTIFPGNWEFNIDGIYTAERRTVDRSTLWFHWDYLNESPVFKPKDMVGWIITRVDEPGQSAAISKKIDAMFDERDTQTVTMSEKALNQSFLGFFSAILKAVDVVTFAILVIIVLILGNTIAMGVRERTAEYGCLRAIGFRGSHLAAFVVGESVTIGLLGGLLGLGISWLLVNQALGPFIEENMGGILPHFRIPPELALVGLGIAMLLALLAAVWPAYRASRLKVVDALRTVE
ncbi:MAG TPA: FtsX-like permease family protein [Kofleriaceae bacterium]|nr:FtsX-like permease family protein [Kofleriaceae bacterium]